MLAEAVVVCEKCRPDERLVALDASSTVAVGDVHE